jgi:hypothetical protein
MERKHRVATSLLAAFGATRRLRSIRDHPRVHRRDPHFRKGFFGPLTEPVGSGMAGKANGTQVSSSADNLGSGGARFPVNRATILSPWNRPFSMNTLLASNPATTTPAMNTPGIDVSSVAES